MCFFYKELRPRLWKSIYHHFYTEKYKGVNKRNHLFRWYLATCFPPSYYLTKWWRWTKHSIHNIFRWKHHHNWLISIHKISLGNVVSNFAAILSRRVWVNMSLIVRDIIYGLKDSVRWAWATYNMSINELTLYSWQQITSLIICGMKLLVHSQTSTMKPKFGNG